MPPGARAGDPMAHGGSITNGSPNVLTNGIPAAIAGVSQAPCSIHPGSQVVTKGSGTVFINNQPAARAGDVLSCGAAVSAGSPDVIIGD